MNDNDTPKPKRVGARDAQGAEPPDAALQSRGEGADAPAGRQPERQQMLAMMLATGRFTAKQVCELLNVTPAFINTMRKSPLFMAQVRRFQAKIYDSVVDQALADVLADTPSNFDFIKGIRDGEIDDEPATLRTRLRAAEVLLERQIPKRGNEAGETGVRIIINAETKTRFDTVDAEVAEFTEVGDGKDPTP